MMLSCVVNLMVAFAISANISKQKTTEVEPYLVIAISLISLFVYVLVAGFVWGFSLLVAILAGLCTSLLVTNRYYELLGL